MRIDLQPAYLLHSRPYRDNSSLLVLLTPEFGRLSAVARGGRRKARGGSTAALLQLFSPLLMSFAGKGELKTMTRIEAAGPALSLTGERLYSGLYLNELLVRLLAAEDPQPRLFVDYAQTLEALVSGDSLEEPLRLFELSVLEQLGYSIDLRMDGGTGERVQEDGWYQFHDEYGLMARPKGVNEGGPVYRGADLLAIAQGHVGGNVAPAAKRLLREMLSTHLGDVPLKSRDLFIKRWQDSGKGGLL